jgi:glutaredoxin
MEFIEPVSNTFTIYSKSGCHNCIKTKTVLKDKKLIFIEVDCDEYLIEERDLFLSFIESKIGKPHNTFPIVFYNGKFIGGYNETIDFINKLLLSFEDIF